MILANRSKQVDPPYRGLVAHPCLGWGMSCSRSWFVLHCQPQHVFELDTKFRGRQTPPSAPALPVDIVPPSGVRTEDMGNSILTVLIEEVDSAAGSGGRQSGCPLGNRVSLTNSFVSLSSGGPPVPGFVE